MGWRLNMCKIFIIPGINTNTRYNALNLIKKMAEIMGASPDNDGMGYAALTARGELFGERWLVNNDAFEKRGANLELKKEIELQKKILTDFGGTLEAVGTQAVMNEYNSFGIGEKGLETVSAMCLHSRFSTNSKEFKNTHPFLSEDGKTALIHNGKIENHEKLKKITSTNDSEVIVHLYDEWGVSDDLPAIQHVASKMYGYYACGVLSEDSNKAKILDIFKESTSNLYGAYVSELSSIVFSTSDTQLDTACKDLGLTIKLRFKFKDNHILRLNPFNGQVIGYNQFTSNGRFEPYNHGYSHHHHTSKVPETTDTTKNVLELTNPITLISQMTNESLAGACDTFLRKYVSKLTEEKKSPVIDINEVLKERLVRSKREKNLKVIVNLLCTKYGWEEWDATLEYGEWLLSLKQSA